MDMRIALVAIAAVVLVLAFFLMQNPSPVDKNTCGDAICAPGEKESCSKDCPKPQINGACGDGKCGKGENTTCPQDCAAKPPISNPSFSQCGDIPPSPVISSASVEGLPISIKSNGDLWMNTWADDDNLYSGWGDGTGFESVYTDLGIAKLTGMPPGLTGQNVFVDPWPPATASGKKSDMDNDKPSSLLSIGGRLYAQFHSPLGDARVGYLAYSDDYGVTWTRLKDTSPWTATDTGNRALTGSNFRCMAFMNMGKDYALNTDGFVYAFAIGMEYGWYGGVYLARVSKNNILDYDSYQYFTGLLNNQPQWSADQDDATPLSGITTHDQFSAMYHPGIGRYLLLTQENLYDAPDPWGPWTCAGRWTRTGWIGYQPGMISKATGYNYFWFTIAGQAGMTNASSMDVSYNLNLGKIVMVLS